MKYQGSTVYRKPITHKTGQCSYKNLLTKPASRLNNRWEDDVMQSLKKIKINTWISCIQNKKKWKEIGEKDQSI